MPDEKAADDRPADPARAGGPLPERTVLVVDDHRAFAEMLSMVLDATDGFRSVGVAHSAEEGVAYARRLVPDLVVLDVRLAADDGLVVCSTIRAVVPTTLVAIVSAHASGEWVGRAAQAGASAYAPKNGSLVEIIETLRAMREGHLVVAPSAFAQVEAPATGGAPAVDLSQREAATLQLLADGMSVRDIAAELGITVNTCRGYVKTVRQKLDVSSQLEAVLRARELGLLPPPRR